MCALKLLKNVENTSIKQEFPARQATSTTHKPRIVAHPIKQK
jgi:hypothetical protein